MPRQTSTASLSHYLVQVPSGDFGWRCPDFGIMIVFVMVEKSDLPRAHAARDMLFKDGNSNAEPMHNPQASTCLEKLQMSDELLPRCVCGKFRQVRQPTSTKNRLDKALAPLEKTNTSGVF